MLLALRGMLNVTNDSVYYHTLFLLENVLAFCISASTAVSGQYTGSATGFQGCEFCYR